MESFAAIFERAAARKGGEAALLALLPEPATPAKLGRTPDDRYLAEMTAAIFRSGFVWQIIENKWPDFETAFSKFDVKTCAMLGEEQLEALCRDPRIVRNAAKIRSVPRNAAFILAIREEHGGFGKWLAAWPTEDIVGLWDQLKRRGDRLGGQTGRFFLRFVGKDTPVLSPDVVRALVEQRVVDKEPTSARALQEVQAAFNGWRAESGRPLCQISRVLACSVGD